MAPALDIEAIDVNEAVDSDAAELFVRLPEELRGVVESPTSKREDDLLLPRGSAKGDGLLESLSRGDIVLEVEFVGDTGFMDSVGLVVVVVVVVVVLPG